MTLATPFVVDIRRPLMIKIGADGQHLPADAIDHVAVLLPQFGLMFDARPPLQADNWHHALQLAGEVNLCGQQDWRLPECDELQLLIERSRFKPATSVEFFPHTPTNDWYWTATKDASASSSAWYVDFGYGDVSSYRQVDGGVVRAVRSVSPSQ